MSKKRKIEDLYSDRRVQIDTIIRLMDGNYRKAARAIAWFYGGSSETWRKFLARRKPEKAVPKEVKQLLGKLSRKRAPK